MDSTRSDLSTLFSFVTHEVRSDLTPLSLYLQRPLPEFSSPQTVITDISLFLDVASIMKVSLLDTLPSSTVVSSTDFWESVIQKLSQSHEHRINQRFLAPGFFRVILPHSAIVLAYIIHVFSLPLQGSIENNFYVFRFPISIKDLPVSVSHIHNKQSFALFALYSLFSKVGAFEVLERELILRLPLDHS